MCQVNLLCRIGIRVVTTENSFMTNDYSLETPASEATSVDKVVSPTDSNLELAGSVESSQHLFKQMIQSVRDLKVDFEEKIKYDESKERTINLLHQELQDYRNDLNLTYLRPLAMEFVVLYDNITKIASQYKTIGGIQPTETVADDFEGLLQDIEDSLARYGFEIYQTDLEHVDRILQHVQKTVPTSNPELDRQIAMRLRKGLCYGERVIRPEGVSAFTYSKPVDGPGNV